jgi:hypothetical protein
MFTFSAAGVPLGSPGFVSTVDDGGGQQQLTWANADTQAETLIQYYFISTMIQFDFAAAPNETTKFLAGIGYPPSAGDEIRLWHRKNGSLSAQTTVVF